MLKRFVCTSLMTFGLGLWLFSSGSGPTQLQADEPGPAPFAQAQPQAIEAQPMADQTSLEQQGVEVLDKGPVHEAFAEPNNRNPQAGPVVHKQPPKPVDEVPPDQKPEGDNAQWIKGYWAWDAERIGSRVRGFRWTTAGSGRPATGPPTIRTTTLTCPRRPIHSTMDRACRRHPRTPSTFPATGFTRTMTTPGSRGTGAFIVPVLPGFRRATTGRRTVTRIAAATGIIRGGIAAG